MSMPLIGFCIFAGLIGMIILIILTDWCVHLYVERRDERARRIRNRDLKRFCITPQFGTKERPR